MDERASRCPGCGKRVGKAGKDGVAAKYYNVGCLIGTILFLFVLAAFIIGIVQSG